MKFVSGKNRFVVIMPTFGIVVKLPIIHLIKAAKNLKQDLSHKGNYLYYELFVWSAESSSSLKRMLFKGILDNWGEYRFYQTTKHSFLQPTYLSLIGLVNIQRLGQKCDLEETDFWCQLAEITNGAVAEDGHHFDNTANFCVVDGRLKILDYGSARTQGVIQEFGDKIDQEFDFSYSWEERKKELRAKKVTNSEGTK